MKKLVRILFAVAMLVGLVSRAAEAGTLPHGPLTRLDFVTAKSLVGDPSALKNGELGDAAVTSDRYDVRRQILDLRIDPGSRAISGTVRMVFACAYEGLQDLVFDLTDSLLVSAVNNAAGALPYTHAGDSVVVRLPAPLAVGMLDSVDIHYGGNRTSPIYNRGLMFKNHLPDIDVPQDQLVPIVANLSQPAYAQYWWPCKDRPDDKFLVSLNLTVPDSLSAVSNGVLVGQTAADPGWMTYSWREDYPIATYLVSIAVSDFVLLASDCTTTLGSVVPLRNWVFPAEVDDAIVDFAPLCDMMDFCESIFGPYPFAGEKYGHAEFLWPGAMEHQTVTSIGSGFVDGEGTHEWLIVHELGHQWFGDSLTPADWADIWLNEGFATYSEALWFEDSVDQAAYFTFLANHRHEADWIAQGPVHDPVPIFPGRVIYDKGAWILHSLRGRMGDGPFFALVEDWTQGAGRELGFVATQEFIDLAGSWAGEDLNGFLWPYLTTTELPTLDFRYTISEGISGADTHLQVNLSQLQSPLFDLVLPLVVTTTAGESTLRIRLDAVTKAVEFDLGAAIQTVALDPDKWLLWRDVSGSNPRPVGLTNVFPNPSRGGYVVFRYWLENEARLEMRFFDVMGREVAARDLGRVDAGLHEWGWDVTGRDDRRLPSGVYWAALYVDGARSVAKFSVVR